MEARKKRQEELDRLREEEQQRTIQELNKQCELFYMANLERERRRQQDEWLIPCDGLLFVNDINLENAFLGETGVEGHSSRPRSYRRSEATSRLAQRERHQRSSGVAGKFPTTSLITNPL